MQTSLRYINISQINTYLYSSINIYCYISQIFILYISNQKYIKYIYLDIALTGHVEEWMSGL